MTHPEPDEIMETVVAATRHLVQDRDPYVFFSYLLDRLVALSGSEFGFVAEVRHRDEQPYLASYAVTDLSWNEETREYYQRHIRAGVPLEFDKLDTLYGHVLLTRELLVTDVARDHPSAAGIPQGHPPLLAFLGVPLIVDDALVGMIALSNREGGYPDSLIREMEPLFTATGFLILAFKNRQARIALSEELELEKLNAEVAARNNLEVIAHVSHDLRTPLNSVMGFAQLLAATDLTTSQRTHVERILTAAGQMTALISNVLDLELSGGGDEVAAKPTNVAAVVASAAEQSAQRAANADVRLEVGSTGPCIAEVDPQKLHRIVDNLVSNAVKYSNAGDRVTVTVRDLVDRVDVEVADTGLGIGEADLARIFEPFERVATEGRMASGSGIGLAIVRRLCDLMHLDLTVESSPDQGSTFTVAIPVGPNAR